MAFAQHRWLVGDVQQRLLAQAGVEGAGAEGKAHRVAPNDRDPPLVHEPVETSGAQHPSRVELERHDPRPASPREKPGWPAEAGAHVEDPAAGAHTGPARQGIHRGEASVVILVELEEVVDGQESWITAPAPGESSEHPRLAKGMVIVELAHAAAGGALKH